jgi:geranylgeranyl diphosphate synthase type II
MLINDFEAFLASLIDDSTLIGQAMNYALMGKGKRLRPLLLLSMLEDSDINAEYGFSCASAIEFIHTYSLIHDDLPAMDNDDMRRGKPSLHKAFREDIAILTGDELLTDAFRVISGSFDYDDSTKVKMISCLSRYAGSDGMIYGQLLDVTSDSEHIDEEKLIEIQENKTSGLFKIACLFPMYIAGMDREGYFAGLGSRIGQIFQNQDDLFDLIKSEKEMGKNLSDQKNNKGTALSVYSREELEEKIAGQFEELRIYLKDAPFHTGSLTELLNKLKER